MANLVFFEENHRYTVDGEEVPSVSELTRFIAREIYGEIQQTVLDTAAARGTKVHKAAEALDKFGSVEIDDDLSGYIKAYVRFLHEHEVTWEKIEWAVNNGLLYAGTLDRYGTVDGVRAIVDLKSTAKIDRGHKTLYTAAQNLYRLAIEPDHHVEKLLILQLAKDGSYKLIELEVQNELAEACITLHQALKKKKRTRKDEKND